MLTSRLFRDYAFPVTCNQVIGIGVPEYRRTAAQRLFLCVSMALPVLGGPCGEPSGSPVPVSGTPTRTVPPTPIGVRVAEIKTAIQEAIMPKKQRISLVRAIEDISTELYHLEHQLQLYADCASMCPPGQQASSVLGESLFVTFFVLAEGVRKQKTRLDDLHPQLYRLEKNHE